MDTDTRAAANVAKPPATPWQAIGWVLFTVLLFCAPAVVWAVYGALL